MVDRLVHWSFALMALAIVCVLVAPLPGSTHPLGNFSISHYTAIRLEADAVVLRYIIDMAEIPTFQEMQDTQIVPQSGHPTLPGYLRQRVDGLRSGLLLELDGARLPLDTESSEMIFPPGAGGLPTLKLGMRLRAVLAGASTADVRELRYRDTNFPGRAGWKEIVVTAGREIILVRSSAPERDRSRELADYPADLLNSPPQDVEAKVLFTPALIHREGGTNAADDASQEGEDSLLADRPGLEAGQLASNRQPTPRSLFTEMVTAPQLGLGIILAAMAVAVGLGAFHALEPGHGKTVVAAYLVGSRGTVWHALMLGLIVTGTHTVGVYLLGAVTLLASHYVVPEQLYPWLGVTSGLIIAGLGGSLFLRRYAALDYFQLHKHGHANPHHHAHISGVEHAHSHAHQTHRHQRAQTMVSPRDLLTLGITGGIVPCPAALVVLLSALSLNRVGLGLLLIAAFSLGLAAVLIAIGVLMVYAHRLMARFQGDGALMTRWLPLTSAAMMTGFGLAIAVQALVSADILRIQL
jgi:ABC-type nickel/cobalt efflux system permease component RcnA